MFVRKSSFLSLCLSKLILTKICCYIQVSYIIIRKNENIYIYSHLLNCSRLLNISIWFIVVHCTIENGSFIQPYTHKRNYHTLFLPICRTQLLSRWSKCIILSWLDEYDDSLSSSWLYGNIEALNRK